MIASKDQIDIVYALLRLLQIDAGAFQACEASAKDNLAIMLASDIGQFRKLCALVCTNLVGLLESIGTPKDFVIPAGPQRELVYACRSVAPNSSMLRLGKILFSNPN